MGGDDPLIELEWLRLNLDRDWFNVMLFPSERDCKVPITVNTLQAQLKKAMQALGLEIKRLCHSGRKTTPADVMWLAGRLAPFVDHLLRKLGGWRQGQVRPAAL